MKKILFFICFTAAAGIAKAQVSETAAVALTESKSQVVEASCGTCKFGMEGKGCELAVKINGKAYFVEGVDLHKLGDAHSADGMCNAVRKAEVTGDIKGEKFIAGSFKLLPQ